MKSNNKIHDVILKINGIQAARGEDDEHIEFITEGKYYRKNNAAYLVYKETEVLGVDGSITTLKIKDDSVRMRRFGSLRNEMHFEKGKRIKARYETPFGSMPMELLTNHLESHIDQTAAKGFVNIDYDVSIRGLADTRNKLNVEIL